MAGLAACSGGGGPTGTSTGGSGTGGVGTGGSGQTGGANTGGNANTGGASTGGSTGGASVGGAPATGGGGGSPVTGGAKGGAPGQAGSTGSSQGGSRGGSSGQGGSTSPSCPSATPLTGGNKYCSNTTGNISGGYSYELWAEGMGSGCMTVYGKEAAFSATWNNVEDFLARVGLTFDRSKTHSQIGKITAEFAETKTGSNGLVYVGVYGWTVDPLREYYILDDWGAIMPSGTASDGTPRDRVGTITVDGEIYDVWKKTRVNKPAITGDNKTFDQYFSIRRTARQCGRISVSEHFSQWIGLGLQLGKLVEAKMLVEAQDSTGSIEFSKVSVVVK